jgi:hypothetical protein
LLRRHGERRQTNSQRRNLVIGLAPSRLRVAALWHRVALATIGPSLAGFALALKSLGRHSGAPPTSGLPEIGV